MVLDRSTAKCHVLNASAGLILETIDGELSVDGLIDELHQLTGVPPSDLALDVHDAVTAFRSGRMVRAPGDAPFPDLPAPATVPPPDHADLERRRRWAPALRRLLDDVDDPARVGPFALAGTSIEIVTDHETAARFDAVTRSLPRTAHAATTVWVLGGGAGDRPWRVLIGPHPFSRENAMDEAIETVMAQLNQVAVAHSGPGVLLHAGAVEVDGSTIVIAGESGRGKSTLIAALVQDGLGYVTDELVVIDPDTGGVTPYPKAVDLSPSSQELLGIVDDDTAGRSGKRRIVPGRLGRVSDGGQVALLVLLGPPNEPAGDGSGRATGAEPVDPVAAILELLPSTFAETFALEDDLDVLGELCATVPVVRLPRLPLSEAVLEVRRTLQDITG